jgi:hypothetical protein
MLPSEKSGAGVVQNCRKDCPETGSLDEASHTQDARVKSENM